MRRPSSYIHIHFIFNLVLKIITTTFCLVDLRLIDTPSKLGVTPSKYLIKDGKLS